MFHPMNSHLILPSPAATDMISASYFDSISFTLLVFVVVKTEILLMVSWSLNFIVSN